MHRFFSTLLIAGFFLTPAAAAPAEASKSGDVAALKRIPQLFSDAWARHDGHALGQLMAPDVDFVTVGTTWLHGRRGFELYHTRLLTKRFLGSTIMPLETRLRFVRPDLAFVRWDWAIVGDRNFDGSPRPKRYGLRSMLAERKHGRWLVIASQNTNQIPGPAPEDEGIVNPISLQKRSA